MDKIKIGVTGTGSLVGQAIIKSILKSELSKKICMVGFDYFKETVGSYWVEKSLLLPDCLSNEVSAEVWLDKVIEHINSEGIKFLFIGLDFELKLFAKYKEVIESKTQCRVLVSNLGVIEISDDKYLTYEFLKNNKLYYPRTVLPEAAAQDMEFPCVVKPRSGWGSRDMFIVNNIRELKLKLPQINQPIIQELIGDSGSEYTCGVIYLDNSLKEIIVLRRNLKSGNTITARFSKDIPKIIYDYISAASDKLKPFGACNFQLRLDKAGIPKVFEINARHSGTTYIRAIFGFNEVEYILSYLLGQEVKKFSLKEGTVKRYYDEIFIGT